MDTVGVMAMPADFRYRELLRRGRPQHARFDDFGARHPKMPCEKRAKIFAPFDALAGFGEAVAAKELPYEGQRVPEQQEREELDRRLGLLRALSRSGRLVKAAPVVVTARFFVPCADENSFAFGRGGLCETVTGVCRGVDPDVTRTLLVDTVRIPFERLVSLESPAFDEA